MLGATLWVFFAFCVLAVIANAQRIFIPPKHKPVAHAVDTILSTVLAMWILFLLWRGW